MQGHTVMYTHPQRRSSKLTQKLRGQAGSWLRELREKRGLSQRELAQRVGAEYYTFISQLEHGRGRIPPDRYLVWAEALGVNPREFVRGLMSFYDPLTYSIVFGRTPRLEALAANSRHPRAQSLVTSRVRRQRQPAK
jgi:transcriptional regulator with XRE-family HTH domain